MLLEATIISASISCIVMVYWLFLKGDTYISFSTKDFRASWKVVKDILIVGLPASAESFVMSVTRSGSKPNARYFWGQ